MTHIGIPGPSLYSTGHRLAEWLPTDLSGCILWLRADLGITMGTGVAAWADQSGLGRHLTQAIGSKQPAFSATGGPNSTPCLTFTASSTQSLTGAWSEPQPIHTFLVARSSATATYSYLFDGSSANQFRSVRWTPPDTDDVLSLITSGGPTITPVPTTWMKWEYALSGGNLSCLFGVLSGSAATGTGDNNGLTIGARGDGAIWALEGSVAEVIRFSSILTGDDLTALRAYINARYGL